MADGMPADFDQTSPAEAAQFPGRQAARGGCGRGDPAGPPGRCSQRVVAVAAGQAPEEFMHRAIR